MLKKIHVFNLMNFANVNEVKQNRDKLLTKYLRSLSFAKLLLARLYLKMKVFIILLRNLYFKNDFCNDTRIIIT